MSAAAGSRSGLAIGWLTMFAVGTDLFAVSPLLPLIAAAFGVSPAVAGFSVTVFSLTYMIGAPFLGHIADRVGRRRMLCWCLVIFGAANLLTALAGNFTGLLAARTIAGAAAAGVSPSIYALAGGAAPVDRRGSWLALVASGLLVSLTLGAPIAGMAGASLGWPVVFAAIAAASFVLAAANHRVWPTEHHQADRAAATEPLTASLLAARLAPMVAWSTALYGVYTYLGAGLAAAGFSTGEIARVIVIYGGGAIAGVMLGGRLTDRLGAKSASSVSLAGLCLSLVLVRLVFDVPMLLVLALGAASAMAQLFFPAQQAGLVHDFPARRATALAWNNGALFLGISLGSLIGGQAVSTGGFAANAMVSAGFAAIGWIINQAVVPDPLRLEIKAIDRFR